MDLLEAIGANSTPAQPESWNPKTGGACAVLSDLAAMSYSNGPTRSHWRELHTGDLALHCCEYSCILEELLNSEHASGFLLHRCHWLLQRMPPDLPGIRLLRKRAVAHCKRSPDFATGWDDARARNVLQWWLSDSALEVTFDSQPLPGRACGLLQGLFQLR